MTNIDNIDNSLPDVGSDKIQIIGKIARFPKNVKPSKAYAFMENVKIPKNKIWYILIQRQNDELSMVKYNRAAGVDLNKFITIQSKSGMPAKDYSHFNEVLDIIKPYLDKENIIPEYNLQFLRYYLDLDVEGFAHNAEDDVRVLKALFGRLLTKMMEETGSEESAIEKMLEGDLFTKFNFGKYKDKTLDEVVKTDARYLEWLLKSKLENEVADEDWIYTLKHYLSK